ncbi:MAG: hypothetical protein HYR74_06140 [Candidatus Eisenbacteria bacterium]|nr:hypothetical protein [Candidatus Eisenbacteria bacterium]
MNGRVITVITGAALVVGATGLWATQHRGDDAGACAAKSATAASCAAGSHASAAAAGCPTGAFDAGMSGACGKSCAAKNVTAADIVAQPGAIAGKATRCPVSGVVFRVDATKPRVRFAGNDYVMCCDACAKKFKKDPKRFVSA